MNQDLYEVLGISKSASKAEIKKAYHKAALSSHPDKVASEEREEAEIRFKTVQAAYEILKEDETRELYDVHGMAAFEKGAGGMGGMPDDFDINEMFSHLFNGGGPGGPSGGPAGFGSFFGPGGPAGAGGGPRRKRPKGKNEEKEHEVTLEELYKGKTIKFASTKNVLCSNCDGTGGKDKAKTTQCATCRGAGMVQSIVSLGGGLMTQQANECSNCAGSGQVYKDKDKCKKCKGKRVISQKKFLELYIAPGARHGERVVLHNEADQQPDDLEPGDLVFVLSQLDHEVFTRRGNDLLAEVKVTLAEALTGFKRVVLKHLDGRGISITVQQPQGQVLRPGQVLKIAGEGMPIKKTDHKGDLFLVIQVEFPKDGWLKTPEELDSLRKLLPTDPTISVTTDKDSITDDVDFEDADLADFGGAEAVQDDEWEDDEEGPQAQCNPQ